MCIYVFIYSQYREGCQKPHNSPPLRICRLPIPPCVYDFFIRGGGMDVMREGRGLNLTIGHLFCQ